MPVKVLAIEKMLYRRCPEAHSCIIADARMELGRMLVEELVKCGNAEVDWKETRETRTPRTYAEFTPPYYDDVIEFRIRVAVRTREVKDDEYRRV